MTYTEVFSKTFTQENDVWSGYTMRIRVPASALSSYANTPTSMRLTFSGGPSESMTVGKCYVGHAGTDWNFTGAVQVTKNSSGSFTVPTGSTLVSDSIPFVWDKVSDIIISAYYNGGASSDRLHWMSTGGGARLWVKQADDAATASPSGFSASGSNPNCMALVCKIELDDSGAPPATIPPGTVPPVLTQAARSISRQSCVRIQTASGHY